MKKPMLAKPPDAAKRGQRNCFDLRDEPWIPVVRHDGTSVEMSLRAALHHAPKLQEIRDPMPTVEFGLYRLLVTMILDIFELKSGDDLETLLESGVFDSRRVDKYFNDWHDRFDLFHEAHPFLQSPGMDAEKSKSLAGLVHALPSGTNASHFHHASEADFGVCPAVAARLLATISPFMTAGGAGLSPSINGAPPWFVLVRGRNLFDSLCLNCPVMRDLYPHAQGNRPPAWRRSTAVTAGRRTDASLLEALTWQPRRIQFVADGPGLCAVTGQEMPTIVREMKFTAGYSAGFEWTDPHVPYRVGNDGRSVLRPQEGKASWRDIGPIALLRADEYQSDNGKFRFERPAIVTQFASLQQQRIIEPTVPLNLVAFGMRTDLKMKVFEWYRDQLSLPAPLLWRAQFHRVAQQEMDKAEAVAYSLEKAIKKAYPRDGAGNKKAFDNLITRAQNDYWTALRQHYDTFLRDLATLSEEDTTRLTEHIAHWRDEIRRIAIMAIDSVIEDLDTDADALERQTVALRSFENSLFVLLDPKAAAKGKGGKKSKSKKEV